MNNYKLNIKRNTQADLVRVVVMIFVVRINNNIAFTDDRVVEIIKNTILYTCNGMFYMLSGRFNLRFTVGENEKKSYIDYYFKKFANIIIPYVLYTIIYYLYSIRNTYTEMNIKGNIWGYVEAFVQDNNSLYFWFMFPLIGMLVSAPFLARLVQKLSDYELKVFLMVGIIWEFVTVIIVRDCFNLKNQYSGWILSSWVFYLVLGYGCDRLIKKENQKFFVVLGMICSILTILQAVFLPDRVYNLYDLSPIYTFATIGMYIFLDRYCVIRNEKIGRAIFVLSKHSFGIYLIHIPVLDFVCDELFEAKGWIGWCAQAVLVVLIACIFSSVFDFLITNRIKGLLKKLGDRIFR